MGITEKVAYLKGLAEGLGLDKDSKEGKLFAAIIDVLDDMALEIEDLLGHLIQNIDDGGKQLALLGLGIQAQALGQTLQICNLLSNSHGNNSFR